MSVADAFKNFQSVVNADIEHVEEARTRRDLFVNAFGDEDDVAEVIPSGSFARGTHKDPIHDVDLIIVFDEGAHADWGVSGESAENALDYTRGRVNALLGATNGTYDRAVRLARWRNHAVKCFLDEPDDPDAFTVDAMPALRRGSQLLIPEAKSASWVLCDPEALIAQVAARHARWNKFAGTVRMLKWWATNQDFRVKSLVMEVLALDYLPTDVSQPAAIKQFFVRACYDIEGGKEVCDPAGLSGPIQPDLDYEEFGKALRSARDYATMAFQEQVQNNTSAAMKHWRAVFREGFPMPPASPDTPVLSTMAAAPRPVKDTPQG